MVCGPKDGLVVRAERCGESGDELVHLLVAGRVAGAGADAGETGDVLAQRVAGDEAVEIVPAAHIGAGSGQAGALAIDLEQTVVREREIVGVDGVVVLLEGAGGELDAGVGELVERLAARRSRRLRSFGTAAAAAAALRNVLRVRFTRLSLSMDRRVMVTG